MTRFILPLVVLVLLSCVVTVSGQKEIGMVLYADQLCKTVVNNNLTLPAFDLSGACFNLAGLSMISQCNTVLDYRMWQTQANCPKTTQPDISFSHPKGQNTCGMLTMVQAGQSLQIPATYKCPTFTGVAMPTEQEEQGVRLVAATMPLMAEALKRMYRSQPANPEEAQQLPQDPPTFAPITLKSNPFSTPLTNAAGNPFEALLNLFRMGAQQGANQLQQQPRGAGRP